MLAIRLDPPLVEGGVPVHVEALAVAPIGTPLDRVSARSCRLDPDLPTLYWSLSCLGEEDLEVDLGLVPLDWTFTLPSTCEEAPTLDTGHAELCASQVPLLVEARAGDEVGYGHVYLRVRPAWELGEDLQPPMASLERALTWQGDASAGGEVALSFRIGRGESFLWYVDAGVLEGTGRTAVQERGEDFVVSNNRLRIPQDWHGPLRVYVVVAQEGWTGGADVTWESLVLEVP